MTREAKDGSQPHADWSLEGAEAERVLDLARAPLPVSPEVERTAEQQFLSAFRAHTATSQQKSWFARGAFRYGLAFAAALVVALAIFKAGTLFQGDALSYRLNHGAATADRVVEAKTEPVQLDFSDGTVITVDRGSRARVVETTRRGARFRLDSGRMTFDVVPHADRGNWSVDAGPFQVRVTGTVFTVEWNAAEGSLSVEVTRGHVIVEGAGQRRELGPGDSFHHREPLAATARPPAAPSAIQVAASELAPHIAAPGASHAEKPQSWSALVSAGSYGAVLEAANQRGLPGCLETCSQEDLRALSDAARLGNNAALAERTQLSQRARFAGTADAASAAFLLGRSAEARGDAKAITWYDTYLAEAPSGRFAGDALGHKMLLLAKRDRKAAAEAADQYLARFRGGPYAGHAQSLIEGSGRGR